MKTVRLALWLVVIAGLSACAASTSVKETMDDKGRVVSVEYEGADPTYALYANTVARQAVAPPAVDVSACNGDATCIVAVAALTGRDRSGGQPVIQPPQPKVSGWVQAGRFVTAIAGITVPAAVNWHQSDNSTESTRALYGMLGGMHAGTVSLGSVPTTVTTIGGDQIGRDRIETTTTVGGNLGDTQTVGGNLGDTQTIGRDLIGRDRIDNDGVMGDNNDTRFGSPGPYDDHSDDGDDCTGDCSSVPIDPIEPGE